MIKVKGKNAITLIALVITIVIMLLLGTFYIVDKKPKPLV